jgi:cytochrome c5
MENQMNPIRLRHNMQALLLMVSLFISLSVPTAQANPMGIPQVPEIPAFLPMAMDVPMTKKLPIDGEWMINDIRKRIRIEGGRAYAVDSWLHLFVLKVQPLMVVQQDWRRIGPGRYSGQDLPLVGPFTANLMPNGNMSLQIQGMFGPVNLTLSPVRIDDQRRFDREKSGRDTRDDTDYGHSEDEYSDDEYADDEYVDDEYADDEYADDEYADDEGDYEEEAAPTKVKAKRYAKAKRGCEGKQVYRSGTQCFSCPAGYKRTSPTRKMTHPEACKERGVGFGKDKVAAKYVWGANGCPKYQFKYKGYCMKCPKGTKRIHTAGLDTGYCRIQ